MLPFGPEHVVLEGLETDEVVAGVTDLAAQGYRIALDDFVYGSGHERLMPLASYVKLILNTNFLRKRAPLARAPRQELFPRHCQYPGEISPRELTVSA